MVDDRPTTDERLRFYIAAQRDRERLSTEILALNPDFSEVQAVRPEGGPDGGKDIVATYRGNLSARAGAGFKATATTRRSSATRLRRSSRTT